MNTIHVSASESYDVIVGRELLENCASYIGKVTKAKRFVVVTDDNVGALYSERVLKSLTDNGFEAECFVFPHGEASKCTATLSEIYEFLGKKHITRSDALIALGGGVTGDMTGYAAATWLRGVDYIQMPTSLLAQVDSSVGGKTAIDIPAGKNLVGAFKQPKLVLCDTSALSTLPREFMIDGMGEVIKYGMIKSKELFDILGKNTLETLPEVIDDIVCRCVSIKRDVVEADEFDHGERMLLNFGHTLGHSIEQYYNYTGISHGCAVGIGMVLMTKIAETNGLCSEGLTDTLVSCLEKYSMPISTEPTTAMLADACLNDKKRAGSSISIVMCSEVGTSSYIKYSVSDFMALLSADK